MKEKDLHSETITLRASPDRKALIDRAARCLGKSRTEFVLDTMCEASENVLLDQRLFWIDEAAFESFQAILDSPPEPTDALRRTMTTPPPWKE